MIKRALTGYCRTLHYRRVQVEGVTRIDLDGQPSGSGFQVNRRMPSEPSLPDQSTPYTPPRSLAPITFLRNSAANIDDCSVSSSDVTETVYDTPTSGTTRCIESVSASLRRCAGSLGPDAGSRSRNAGWRETPSRHRLSCSRGTQHKSNVPLLSGQSWQRTIGQYDGYIFVVAEYNHSITGALKNALDQAYKEWNRKPFTAIGYGGVGAARAIEHLRGIGVELEMVSTRSAVHIGGSDFMAVFPMGGNKPIEEIEAGLLPSATAALDDLVWWAKATMAARAATV